MDRIAPTLKPQRKRQGFQRWDRLLFSHWVVPEAVLRPLVHPRLSLDSFEGRCFVGLVAFTMKQVRPFDLLPPVPTAHEFAEINLRTYVHLDGEEPGVWFFSLDAASTLAVQAARLLWRLPYFKSAFEHEDDGVRLRWRSERRWPRPRAGVFEAAYEIGPARGPSPLGGLEFFVIERYQFYAARGSSLLRARVHHAPYVLHDARVMTLSPSLLTAAGLPSDGERLPDYFSPGVDVDVYSVERVPESAASATSLTHSRP